jgi:urease accessory protein
MHSRRMNSDRVTSTEATSGGAESGSFSKEDETVTRSATAADAAWICGMLQTGDSFYPTGSYAHSFGLEGLVQAGVVRDRATLHEFIFRSVLPALRQSELPLAAHAWRALGTGDWPKVGEICHLSAALKTSREARTASHNIGRQRAELVASLRDYPLAKTYLAKAETESWPFSPAVSATLEGRSLDAPLVAVLSGVTYATLASVLSAAMKLLRLGQNASQSLLTDALADAPAMIAAAELVPLDEIGWFNPWLDIAAARHEITDARMFIS